jgi:TP901 family phage tail tape measure protein
MGGTIEFLLKLRDEMTSQLGQAKKQLKELAGDFKEIGRIATVGLTVPILAAAGAATSFASEFESSSTKLVTLSGLTEQSMRQMRDAVLELAPAVGIGPTALNEALLVITSTGIQGADALDVLKASAKGSAIGLGDTKDVARALVAALNAYGVENLSAAKASDILFAAVQAGGAEANEFAGVLGRVIGTASQVGIGFDELTTFIATFTRLGVDASEATTALSGVMATILKPSKEAREQLQELGLSVDVLRQKIRDQGLTATLLELVNTIGGNQDALGAIIPNVRALAGVMGNAGSQAEAYNEVLKAVQGSTGELDKQFDRTAKNGSFTWAQLQAQAQTLAITVGNELAPALRDLLEAAKPVLEFAIDGVKWFAQLPEPIKLTGIAVVGLTAALGPVLYTIGTLIDVVATIGSSAVFAGAVMAIKAIGVAAWAAAPQLAAFAVAAGSVVAIGSALRNAYGLYTDRIEQAKLATAQQTSHTLALAEASRVAGRTVTDQGEAMRILTAHNASLRAEQQFLAQVAADVKKQLQSQGAAAPSLSDSLKRLRAEVQGLTKDQRTQIAAGVAMGMSDEEIGKQIGKNETVIKLYREGLKTAEDATKKATDAAEKFADSVQRLDTADFFVPFKKAIESQILAPLKELDGSFDLTAWLAPLKTAPTMVPPKTAWQSAWGGMKDGLEGVLEGIPDTLIRAFEGGGDILGAIKSIASQIGATLGEGLGEFIGGPVGGMIGKVLGSFAGPLVGKLASAFGVVSAEVRKARQEIDEFQTGLTQSLTATQRVEAGGVRWKQTLIFVRDAYLSVGRSAEEAEAITRQLWDTDHPDRARAAIEEINRVLEEQRDRVQELQASYDDTGREIDGLIQRGRDLGYEFDRAGNLTGVNLQRVREVAQDLGVDFTALGPAFRQAQITDEATRIINAFELMDQAGGDTGTVLVGVKDELGRLVGQALAAGTALPANMQPWIQELVRTNQLVDENGEAITDISQLEFGDPVKTQWEEISSALRDAANTLASIAQSLQSIPSDVRTRYTIDHVDNYYSNDFGSRDGDESHGYAYGGAQAMGGDYLVTRPTVFVAGEAGAERATFTPMGGGSGGRDVVFDVTLEIDGTRLARKQVRPFARAVRQARGA